MKITLEKEYSFKPVWNENHSNENPIIVNCQYLTMQQKERCLVTDVFNENGETKVKVTPNKENYFLLGVRSFENLEINGEQILKPKDFMRASSGLSGLFDEIVYEIISRESKSEEQLKNSQ